MPINQQSYFNSSLQLLHIFLQIKFEDLVLDLLTDKFEYSHYLFVG